MGATRCEALAHDNGGLLADVVVVPDADVIPGVENVAPAELVGDGVLHNRRIRRHRRFRIDNDR